jgi:hypothetical protein
MGMSDVWTASVWCLWMFLQSARWKITKIKKTPSNEAWKRRIVEETIERKRLQGPGDPLEIEPNDLYEEQEMVEDLNQRLEELLYFSDSDENFED